MVLLSITTSQIVVSMKMSKKSSRRPWRRRVKKQQRKRKRQSLAKERDKALEGEELKKLNDPLYGAKLMQEEQLEQLLRLADEREHNENEEQWLRRELLAQKAYKSEEQKRLAKEKLEEQLRRQQEMRLKEQEDALRRKTEMIQKQNEEAAKEFEESMLLMEKYLEDAAEGSTPPHLQRCFDSRHGEKLCELYTRTNCCRFGIACVYNHQRKMLSNVILIKHFFQHTFLDTCSNHQEYSSADEHLEVSEQDCQEDYAAFCQDVWPELESFGSIVNFRTVRNKMAHTKGHVFVEYVNKRSALKAFIKLQDRYYASKRLKVEFSHITHWRAAICGMTYNCFEGLNLVNKCPKGDRCNYLHLMQNPGNKYNMPLETHEKNQSHRLITPLPTALNWNDVIDCEGPVKSQRWRWSESPEIELESSKTSIIHTKDNVQFTSGENLKLVRKSALLYCRSHHKQPLNLQDNHPVNADNKSSTTKCKNEQKKSLKREGKQKHKSHKRKSSKEKHKSKHKKRDRMSLGDAENKEKTRKSPSRSKSRCHGSNKHCDESCSAEISYSKQKKSKRSPCQESQNKFENQISVKENLKGKDSKFDEARGRSLKGNNRRERSAAVGNSYGKSKGDTSSHSEENHKKHRTSNKLSKNGRK